MAPTRTELLCFVPNLSLALRWSRASYADANRLHLRHLIIQPACPLLMEQQRHCKSSRLPPHIPSDSYANAVAGCLHTGEGAGRACMNDLVVDQWASDGENRSHPDCLFLHDV